jgi:hypothetical protein
VAAAKMNVFYEKVDNPLLLSYKGKKKFIIETDFGKISESYGTYYINFDRPGICKITLKNLKGKDPVQFQFRVKRFPTPTATISGKYHDGDSIHIGILRVSTIIPVLENFDFELFFKVLSFDVLINFLNDDVVKIHNEGRKYSEKLMSSINKMGSGDKILFYNILTSKPFDDEIPLKTAPVEIIVK